MVCVRTLGLNDELLSVASWGWMRHLGLGVGDRAGAVLCTGDGDIVW